MIIRYDIRFCGFCGSKKVLFDKKRAEVYCGKCGAVLSDRLLYADLAENVLYAPKKKELLFVLPNELRTLDERAMLRAYHDLNTIDNVLNLRRYVRKEVLEMYMGLFKKGKTERKSRMKILGALILIISRRDKLPYLDKDIAFACYYDEKSLLKTAKSLAKRIGVKLEKADPSIQLIPVAHGLGLSQKIITMSAAVCGEIVSSGVLKHVKPENIIAVSIMVGSEFIGERINLNRLCKKTSTSRSTLYRLRNRVESIIHFLKII